MIFEPKEFIAKDGTKVIIRTPTVDEAADFLTFIREVCDETDFLLSSGEDFDDFTIEKERNLIENLLAGNDYLLAAYVDGKIIGDFSISFRRQVKVRHRAEVGIVIRKEYWNKGIGSIMFNILFDIAKQKGNIEQLDLERLSTNTRAEALYKKFGFVETGIRPNAYKLKDGSYVDEVLMSAKLEK